MEFFKLLNDENRNTLLYILNQILDDPEKFSELQALAKVVSIYKKGDDTNFENYRPISLLQNTYKIIAALIQVRLAAAYIPWITKTQYGFRQSKSTSHALYLARRILNIAERSGINMALILLDWEKAFDKVDQAKLIEVLERINVPPRLLALL